MIFIQSPLPTAPQSESDLIGWSLGCLVFLSVAAFGYLIKQINSYQNDIKGKDALLMDLTRDLSKRNERNAELIKEFTLVIVDHSKKLEAVADLLMKSNNDSFESFKQEIKSIIQEYIIEKNKAKG